MVGFPQAEWQIERQVMKNLAVCQVPEMQVSAVAIHRMKTISQFPEPGHVVVSF
jgi:hypothetical protein